MGAATATVGLGWTAAAVGAGATVAAAPAGLGAVVGAAGAVVGAAACGATPHAARSAVPADRPSRRNAERRLRSGFRCDTEVLPTRV